MNKLTRINAHQHIFDFDAHPTWWSWTCDENLRFIRSQNHTLSEIGPEHVAHGFRGCIAVEAGGGIEEAEWLDKQGPMILAITSSIDPLSDRLDEDLERLRSLKRVKAVRVIAQGRAKKLYTDPKFQQGVQKCFGAGLVFELLVYGYIPGFPGAGKAPDLEAALELVQSCPNGRFVLDHIGKPPIADGTGADFAAWEQGINALAGQTNVVGCKFSGLVTEGLPGHYELHDYSYFLGKAWDAFGQARAMFGSDGPMYFGRCDFSKVVGIQQQFLARLNQGPQVEAMFFHGNAERIYGIHPVLIE